MVNMLNPQKPSLRVYLAIRDRQGLVEIDRTLFSLASENRFLSIQITALVGSSLKDDVSQIVILARKHRFNENNFQYVVIPEPALLRSVSFLGDIAPNAFMLLDSKRVIYPQSAKRLLDKLDERQKVDSVNSEVVFSGARVSRCDFAHDQYVTSKDPLYGDAKDINDLVCSPVFLDYGCGIYSAEFFQKNREFIVQHLSELDFDSILKLALSRKSYSLEFYSTPMIELYVDQLDARLAPLSYVQLQLAEHQRTITSLEYELSRLRDENFNLATERNLLLQQKQHDKGFRKIKCKISRVKSVIFSLTRDHHVN